MQNKSHVLFFPKNSFNKAPLNFVSIKQAILTIGRYSVGFAG